MAATSSNPVIILDPAQRVFPEFSLKRLLSTVFEPVQDCRICVLTDFSDPATEMKGYAFLASPERFPVQCMAHESFVLGLRNGVISELSMRGGDMFAFTATGGSNLDMDDGCFDSEGRKLSLDADIYSNYDIILCVSDWSATAPLTAKCRQFGFRGATLHGLNDIILQSGLAVDYLEVSKDTEKLRLALSGADEIEIDFTLDDSRILTTKLFLGGQEAQKSHGLCRGKTPDVANLPAGEVYFVPEGAEGQFPMKYEDGTLGILDVQERNIFCSTLIEGTQATIDAHNARLADDPMTGTLGELGFGTQVLPVAGADIQDEKILGTCHIATGRDDHLGGDIMPGMFKVHENSTHDDILFAPHKTPSFDISQVRMRRGAQEEVLIEHFKPGRYLIEALA
jgi:aminopeptidase